MKNKRVEFKPPSGAVPEGTQAGETFDLVVTFRLEKDGSVCVEKMGETDMDYDEKEDKSLVRPGMDDYSKSVQSAMIGGENAPAPEG